MEAIWAEILAQAEGGSEGETTGGADKAGGEQKSGETGGTKEQDKKEGDKPTDKPGSPCASSLMDKNFLFLMLAMFAIMYFIMIRPQKKRQQQQQKMLQEITKNTRVRTIGGIIGTVVDTREDEVVIKIDEANNTKMRIARSAIGKVLTDEEEEKK
jgi:preprotein translocase subunit YajC